MVLPTLVASPWFLVLLAAYVPDALGHSNGAYTLVAQNCRWNKAGRLQPHEDTRSCPLIVDDATGGEKNQWMPWSHRPTCAYPTKKGESKYCVFSFSPSRNASGVSLMTSPEIAAEAVGLLEDPDWEWEPWTPAVTSIDDPPWQVRDIPGKGKGVITTRRIRKGDVLMRDTAVLIGLMRPPESIAANHRKIILQRAFKQLPKKEQDRVMALSRSKGGGVLEDILSTNIFGITLSGHEGHMGLFPLISRINHDCKPNCFTRFSRRRLTMEAVAYRDIEPGEELSISYTPLNMLTADRQEILQRWGFTCGCRLCSSHKDREVSDRNRQRIQDILVAMDKPENREYETLIGLTEEMLALVKIEGLTAQVGDFYTILAHAYSEMGYPKTAERFAVQSVEKLTEFVGQDSEQVQRAQDFLKSLEGARR